MLKPASEHEVTLLPEIHKLRRQYAVIDLGSNSFHMVLAYRGDRYYQVMKKVKNKIQLAAGIDAAGYFTEDTIARAIRWFEGISDIVERLPRSQISIVGTHALRTAKNANLILEAGESILDAPIKVASGEEEARLIFRGLSMFHALNTPTMVIDIGGGSTEFVLGQGKEIEAVASLSLGCVSSLRYIDSENIREQDYLTAKKAAAEKLSQLPEAFFDSTVDRTFGCSGTFQSIPQILSKEFGIEGSIELEHLALIKAKLFDIKRLANLKISGLSESRRRLLPSGLAIIEALFEELPITSIRSSRASMRDGMLYHMFVANDGPLD